MSTNGYIPEPNNTKNFGFMPDDRNALEKSKDYMFGAETAITPEILQPDGQWLKYLGTNEYQNFNWGDTMSCVSFSALNCLEIIWNRRYKPLPSLNLSDRFTAKMSNTSRQGNTFYRVAESLRKVDGEVYQDKWLNESSSWEDYYKEIPSDIQVIGRRNLKTFHIQYEFIPELFYPSVLMKALQQSPLQIAIFAYGVPDANGVYHNVDGMAPNHAVTLVGYKENEYWIIQDHYVAHETRKIAWDYRIGACLRLNIILKNMLFLKEKGIPHIYWIVGGKKIMVIDVETLSAIEGLAYEEVDTLAQYPSGGSVIWLNRTVN